MSVGDIYPNLTQSSFNNTLSNSNLVMGPIYTNNVMQINHERVSISGALLVNDVDIGSTLSDMMKVLMVIQRDLDMERRYPRLKEAYDNYNKVLSDYQLIDDMKGNK